MIFDDFDSNEDEEQYLRFLRRFRPERYQNYMKMKTDRPHPPDFDDGDIKAADDETTTTTPLPTEEQPAAQPERVIDSQISSLGGYPSQDEFQFFTDMMVMMEGSCSAMERAATAKDKQIAKLVAALAAQKNHYELAGKKQAEEVQ